MFLVQALTEAPRNSSIAFTIVVDRAYTVMGEEVSSPEGSALAAFWQVVPLEFPNSTVRLVDVDAREPEMPEQAIGEIRRAGANETLACRRKTRWQQVFEPVHLGDNNGRLSGGISLRPGGVYLITGGTGGIGLVLARHIAQITQGLLVLTARTPALPREQWGALLTSPDTALELREKVEAFQSICDAGGRVLTVQADAADATAMRRIVAELRQQYGAVNGVIHAAGVGGGRIICASTQDDVRAVLAPKVKATEWIRECIGQPQLDFVLFCSSINAVLPKVGLALYAGANAWLDGFASIYDEPAGTRVISVDWDRWRDVGMVANVKVPAEMQESWKQLEKDAIRPNEGIVVFDKVLACPAPQMIVSARDFELLRRAVMNAAAAARTIHFREKDTIPGPVSQQVSLGTDEDVEAIVMGIWEELLGVPIQPQDNFFELGGHSLIGTQVLSRIRERFGVSLGMPSLFEAVTPVQLAERIRLMRWALNPVQEMEATEEREEIGI
jgi:NAD(P)-dependent dehydrogenase (short-subunit alcohol dehydrogenase family)